MSRLTIEVDKKEPTLKHTELEQGHVYKQFSRTSSSYTFICTETGTGKGVFLIDGSLRSDKLDKENDPRFHPVRATLVIHN